MKNPLKTVIVLEERAEEVTRAPNVADLNACEEDTPLRDELRLSTKIKTKVKEGLVRCLRANVDLFTISPHEMPTIDPSVACNQLNIDLGAWYVSQRRRRQSLEKEEATTNTVQYLL
ncbi:hypothetical protein KIW84_075924 [Lathyrus oleraceus]|uniref:Uncharacterized protein n=1 Tax=Pisum sativum TaxID=3888 RepID=A0A9D4VWG5_PEA|nr:hypothetical protein KIW84_075924 [Pisum sativum]